MTDPNGFRPIYNRDYRCSHCGRFLFSARIGPLTRIDIRCVKCKQMQRIEYLPELQSIAISMLDDIVL